MRRFLPFLALMPGVMPIADAATCTWTGAGSNNNWSTAANWDNCGGAHSKPVNGDGLVFPAASPRPSPVNDFSSLTVQRVQLNGSDYYISGNAIKLSNGLTVNSSLNGTDSGSYFELDMTLVTNAQSFVNNGQLPALLAGKLNLNNQTLTVGGGANLNIAGNVVGSGHIIKNGVGTLFLEGTANTYTGPTTINNGYVDARDSTSLGAIGAGNITNVTSGGSLVVDFGITIAEPLHLAGFGINNYGALLGGFPNNHVNGDILLVADASIGNYNTDNSFIIDGVISGAFTLYKTGTGVVRLTNTNTNPKTIISAGTLQVDGVNSTIEIDSGGTLAGIGHCSGTTSLSFGGSIAPGRNGGGSFGTLHGDALHWYSTGVLSFKLDGAGDARSDHLALSQDFGNYFGGTHEFQFNDGSTPPTVGMTYTLVTFASTNFSVGDLSISYVGTGPAASMNGTLTLTPTELLFTPASVQSDLIFRNGFN